MSPPYRANATSLVTPLPSELGGLEDAGVGAIAPRLWRARVRRWAPRLLLLVPGLSILLMDAALRGSRLESLRGMELFGYAKSAALGTALWGGLVLVGSRRRGALRVLAWLTLLTLAVMAVGCQLYTFRRYDAFLTDRSVFVGTSMLPSIGQQLWFDRATFAKTLLPPVVSIFGVVYAVRTLSAARRVASLCGLDIALIAFIAIAFKLPRQNEQDATPDALYVNGMGQLLRARWDHNEAVERVHPSSRVPIAVPALVAHPLAQRNVLLVLTESVRATSTCVSFSPGCAYTPFSNQAAKGRIALTQMRAVDSTTAISLAVMWAGLLPTESRSELHSAPLLFEYAHAAKIDVAYWTSQNLMFGNSGAWLEGLPLDHHVSATQLEAEPTMETGADDAKLISYVEGDLSNLKEPFLGVVHLSNTHFPYVVDEEDAPFVPQSELSGPGDEVEIRNRYQDAIYLQDKAVGHLIQNVRQSAFGARTVIVFLSDHGEQLREKGAVGHTGTLYDPEIHIPAWVDAPEATLTANEEAHLRALRDVPVTSLDVLPTLLDLIGVWDAKGLAPFRTKMEGQSLLRGGSSPGRAVVMTNCSEIWACAFRNWGAMRGAMKLIGNESDRDWKCFDVAADPDEERALGLEACGDLQALAEGSHRGRPF